MSKNIDNTSDPTRSELGREVAAQAKRKIKARRNATPGLWFGMGMMGIVGWSISIPILSGIALGSWLDRHLSDDHSWTLALMMAGLTLGCFNAWHWITREGAALSEDDEDPEKPNEIKNELDKSGDE